MPAAIPEVQIERLTVGERLELIEQLWNSLPESVEAADVPEWHLAELARRRAAAESQPGVGKPWREVLGSLETRP
jgi:putative addiction module component (TIGR02574 family)